MKIVSLLILGSVAMLTAQETNHTAWQWQQAVTVDTSGLTLLALPPETLHASRASLADLRVVSPDAITTPYLLDSPQAPRVSERTTIDFKASLVARTTVLEAATNTHEAIEAITLLTPAREFLKSLRIEAKSGTNDWKLIAPSEVLFRQPNGTSRLRIPLPPASWSHLRVTIDDDRSAPIPCTGLNITLAGKRTEQVSHLVALGQREELRSTSRQTLQLGGPNLHLSELSLAITDPVFSRSYSLSYVVPSREGEPSTHSLGKGSLYRVIGEHGATTESLTIPIHTRVPAGELLLTIENSDSPPLTITGTSATRYPTTLVFFAPKPGAWSLFTGNSQADKPSYGLSRLRSQLKQAGGTHLSPGPLTRKSDFRVPPTLPEIQPTGAGIELAGWSWRSPIEAPAFGVLALIPDPLTLARSRSDLRDLRVIQNGKQIPFLINSSGKSHTIIPNLIEEPDPDRPSVSRWKVTLPMDELPARELRANSPSPLFTRSFRALVHERDSLGNPRTRTLGSAHWTKTSTTEDSKSRLSLSLSNGRLPQTFYLETDNGDNPPIPLEEVTVHLPAPSLILKRSDPAPLYLYFGNQDATPPRYDLRLVRAELLAAKHQATTFGDAEELLSSRNRGQIDAGSPWLWLALGLLVAFLLVVVAKLLPRTEAAT